MSTNYKELKKGGFMRQRQPNSDLQVAEIIASIAANASKVVRPMRGRVKAAL